MLSTHVRQARLTKQQYLGSGRSVCFWFSFLSGEVEQIVVPFGKLCQSGGECTARCSRGVCTSATVEPAGGEGVSEPGWGIARFELNIRAHEFCHFQKTFSSK